MHIRKHVSHLVVAVAILLAVPNIGFTEDSMYPPDNPVIDTEKELEIGVTLKKECADGDAACKADCASKDGDAQKECLKLCEESYQRCLAVSQNQP
ncbi:hypothetical protein [Desulfovibrio inopinatus]|uniref:hypothetical protein n=1 Tax=Desulfovibrio inopinatus TaxID=102109 RepID=UPI00042003C6|nr:hypothetical protein [Desulfovibrio inopinatus]